MKEDILQTILEQIYENPKTKIQVDLENQILEVTDLNLKINFYIDAYKKTCLLNGYDDFDYILNQREAIEQFEQNRTDAFFLQT